MNQRVTKRAKRMKWAALPLATALLLGMSSTLLPQMNGTAYAESYSSQVKLKLANLNMQVMGQSMRVPGGLSEAGDTYVGLAFLSKQLGLKTSWNPKTGYVTVRSSNKTLKLKNQSTEYELNGHRFYGNAASVVINGTTYVPLRFLLQQMGYRIGNHIKDKLITIQPLKENNLKLTNQLIDKSQKDLSITVQFPQLEGWHNAAVQTKLNEFFKKSAQDYITAGQELLEQSTAGWTSEEFPMRFNFDVNYTITSNEQNKLSMHFDPYEYTGGAHGMYDQHSHTFDLTTGEELSLARVTNNPEYKTIINAAIQKQIKEGDLPLLEPFKSIRDDQGFFLQGNAIVIYFSLYEYTPYAAGIPEFSIPLSSFK